MFKRISIQVKMPLFIAIMALAASAAYSAIVINEHKNAIIHEADERLLIAANSAKAILGPDYHGRIADKSSVPSQKYNQIVAAYDGLCLKTSIQYLWSLILLDDRIYFTSGTHENADANFPCADFMELHSNPEAYRHAFATMQPEYSTFHDKWGRGRMLLIPELDSKGRKCLYAASIQLDELEKNITAGITQAILISAVICVGVLLGSFFIARSLAQPLTRLTRASEQIAQGNLSAELSANGSLEISILSASLDTMRKAIREQLEELKREVVVRRMAEDAMRSSEERLRLLAEQANDIILRFDRNGQILDANHRAVETYGYSLEELRGMSVRNLRAPEAQKNFEEHMQRVEEGHGLIFETTHRRKKGTTFPIEASVRAIELNSIKCFQAIIRDITDRKRVERALRESELFLQQGERLARLGGWKTNPFTDSLLWTQGVYHIVEAPLTYRPHLDEGLEFYTPPYRPLLKKAILNTLENGTPFTLEVELITANGKHLWAEVRGLGRVDEAEGSYVTGTIQDITERKLVENQVLQSRKMEAIGQLAGGVAHDFNNLLMIIMSHASLLGRPACNVQQQEESIAEITRASERGAMLTRQLLAFSRRQAFSPKSVNLNDVVAGVTRMLQRLIGEHITLQFLCQNADAPVYADAGMLEQVILNLAVNSRDAMLKGGAFTIETRTVVVSPTMAKIPNARPGLCVCLRISDTGCGISPEHLPHIFEPFYTTKDVGKGTGLGLATTFGIVHQHQGWIDVESVVGKGTVFSIYLPFHQAQDAAEPATLKLPDPNIQKGHETILLVEDEPGVRHLLQLVLSEPGYRVLDAASGTAALQVWREHRDEIDLLLTDIVMPEGISGWELADQMLADNPKLKVIYSSGYDPETSGESTQQRKDAVFLRKPFDPSVVLQKIREQLDSRE